MPDRVTIQHLERLALQMNRRTGNPTEPYSAPGVAAVGCYHVAQVYGGVRVEQIMNDGGGTRHVLPCSGGIVTRRALYDLMQAWLDGNAPRPV